MTIYEKKIPLKQRLDILNNGHVCSIEYVAELLMKMGEMSIEPFMDGINGYCGYDFADFAYETDMEYDMWPDYMKPFKEYTVSQVASMVIDVAVQRQLIRPLQSFFTPFKVWNEFPRVVYEVKEKTKSEEEERSAPDEE